MTIWFDNHCHLTTMKVEPAAAVAIAAAESVGRLLTVGCTIQDSARAIEIAAQFDNVWATAGVHPHHSDQGIEGLSDLLDQSEVVAVGECGLDYYYDNSPRSDQREMFAAQIELAHLYDLPLVIHSRQAWDDTFSVLAAQGVPERTVFHCFTGGPVELERCLAIGAVVSYSGIVTYPSAPELQAAARMTPIDRMMVETDSPYLAPVPVRGKANQPANVAHIGRFLAELKGVDVEVIADATTATANKFYRLGEPQNPAS